MTFKASDQVPAGELWLCVPDGLKRSESWDGKVLTLSLQERWACVGKIVGIGVREAKGEP